MSGKRVLLMNTVAGKGSVGRIVTGLSTALENRGCDSLICLGRWESPAGHEVYRIGSERDVYIHGALSRLTDRHGLYSVSATKKLIEKIREYDPDIIHIHNVHGYYVNYKELFSFLKNEYALKEGHRIIWTLHDCWAFTGHCVHFEYAGCIRWKEGCHDCPEKKQYPASLLLDNSKENYRLKKRAFTGIKNLTLVTPSVWLKDRVEESFLKEYPVHTVPTGIDLSVFKEQKSTLRERYGIGEKTLLLGAANPWRERKGFDDFLKLADAAGEDTVIVMVGLNKAQVSRASAHRNIIPVMKTDSIKEMAEWYSAADIYVNLTYEDTFPTTNLEAMACGTPVITYRAGGSPEALTGESGIVTAVGDIGKVLRAVKELKERDSRETALSCIEQASRYSLDKMFSRYLDDVYGLRTDNQSEGYMHSV